MAFGKLFFEVSNLLLIITYWKY